MTRTEEILRTLVAFDSVSARSNDPCLDWIESALAARGWKLDRRRWVDAAGVPKSNLIASSHGSGRAELALAGHVDTVPVDPAWSEARTVVERDGRLHGLGACDMKGFVASCVALGESLDPGSLRGPLELIFTADEEIGCLGAKRLADEAIISARRVIVGEPTGLRPVRAGKGYGLGRVTVRGREAHSAFPARGHSAIFDAARILARLESLAAELIQSVAPAYDPPHPTLNVGLIHGGRAKNIVPGSCEITVEFRPLGDADPAALGGRIAEALAPLGEKIDFTFEVVRADRGFETSAEATIVRALEAATNAVAGTVSFGTEAPCFASFGADAVVCGPGDMTRAHRRDEFIHRDELAACDALLSRMVSEFCRA